MDNQHTGIFPDLRETDMTLVLNIDDIEDVIRLYKSQPIRFGKVLNSPNLLDELKRKYNIKREVVNFRDFVAAYDVKYGTKSCYLHNNPKNCIVNAAKWGNVVGLDRAIEEYLTVYQSPHALSHVYSLVSEAAGEGGHKYILGYLEEKYGNDEDSPYMVDDYVKDVAYGAIVGNREHIWRGLLKEYEDEDQYDEIVQSIFHGALRMGRRDIANEMAILGARMDVNAINEMAKSKDTQEFIDSYENADYVDIDTPIGHNFEITRYLMDRGHEQPLPIVYPEDLSDMHATIDFALENKISDIEQMVRYAIEEGDVAVLDYVISLDRNLLRFAVSYVSLRQGEHEIYEYSTLYHILMRWALLEDLNEFISEYSDNEYLLTILNDVFTEKFNTSR